MTIFEIIFTVALIAGFIGFVFDIERRFAKENEDTSINKEGVIELLQKMGIKEYTEQEEKIVFNYRDSLFWVQITEQPIVFLGFLCIMDDSFDLDLAKKTAQDCMRDGMNLKMYIQDDRACNCYCMTFANSIESLSEAIPAMIYFLEESKIEFLQYYQKNLSERVLSLESKSSIPS